MASLKTSYSIKEISEEIGEDEVLLWQGKPQKASFVLSKSVQMMPIALLWLAFDGFFLAMVFANGKGMPPSLIIFLCIFFSIHLLPVWVWIHSIFSAKRKYKDIEYAFTNKRIISREHGILQSYYYSKLRRVSVKVGLIDKMFKVGDITVSGKKTVVLLDLDTPYAIGNKLQEFIDNYKKEKKGNDRRNYEYEEYKEDFDSDISPNEYQDQEYFEDTYEEYYDDSKYQRPVKRQSHSSEKNFASSSHAVRFTSKMAPPEKEEKASEEDDYLDNIMSKIDSDEL